MKKFILLFLIYLFSFGQDRHPTFIIASGKRGTPYYKVAKYIAHQYNKYVLKDAFFVIESKGSDENIKLLQDNYADFAIVQRNVLIRDIFSEIAGAMKKIEIIVPLFEEKLRIYYHSDKVLNIRQLEDVERVKSGRVRIGFTSKRSEAYFVFKDAIRLLDIGYLNIEEVIAPYDSLVKSLKSGDIDFMVMFSLPLEELEKDEHIK